MKHFPKQLFIHRSVLVITRQHTRLQIYRKSAVTKHRWQLNHCVRDLLLNVFHSGPSRMEPGVEICKDVGGRYFTFYFICDRLLYWSQLTEAEFVLFFFLMCSCRNTCLSLHLSVSGMTMRKSFFAYHQVNLFRFLTLYPAALHCWDSLSLSLSIVHSVLFCLRH